MIRVSVLYPAHADKKFNLDYYCNTHIPLVQQKLGGACKRVSVEKGLAGAAPGTPPPYIAVGHLFFDSVGDFQAAFAPHSEAILADIPNYTDIQPVFQISEVVL